MIGAGIGQVGGLPNVHVVQEGVLVWAGDFQKNKLLKNILTLCSDLALFHKRSHEISVFQGKEISLYEAYIESIRTIILNPARFAQIATIGFKKEKICFSWNIDISSILQVEIKFHESLIPLNDSMKSPEEESVTQSMILETTSVTSFE